MIGNYFGTNPPCGEPGTTYAYNISPTGVSNCGGTGAQSFSLSTITSGFSSYVPYSGNQGGSPQPKGDYRLLSGSPLLNNGSLANYPALDRAGVARYSGSAPDAGAYESP